MAPSLKTFSSQLKMAGRRSCDVNHIRVGGFEQFTYVVETLLYPETFLELLCHEGFPITNADNFTAANPTDLGCMGIGDFAATDDCDLKHVRPCAGNFRSIC